MLQWVVVLFLLGTSLALWSTIGCARFLQQRHNDRNFYQTNVSDQNNSLSVADVAVVIPARNEELTIDATLKSVTRLVPADNVHVIADGCDDATEAIARSHGVHVLALSAGGKAAGIESAVRHFNLCQKFSVLLILDADTELNEKYVERGLLLLNDPAMSAVAGYAHTTWRPEQLTLVGRFLVSYRSRLYAVMQWIKYGQTWRYTNVTPIVPGFASMYRTKALSQIEVNPPGLVIEDFNMTFELHRKRLGKIAFDFSVFGRTQDPDNLKDYYRQIKRWFLGFWQTLRRHGLWPSFFSAALCVFLIEIIVASVVLLFIALSMIFLAVNFLDSGLGLDVSWYAEINQVLSGLLSPINLLLFLFVPDYALTCVVAMWLRRPSLLIYGLGFLFVRLLDSTATLWTLQQAWRTTSTGRWNSPRRRPVTVAASHGGVAPAGSERPAQGPDPAATGAPGGGEHRWPLRVRQVNPVVRDTLLVIAVLAITAWIVVVAVPLTVVLAGSVLGLVIAAVWSHRR